MSVLILPTSSAQETEAKQTTANASGLRPESDAGGSHRFAWVHCMICAQADRPDPAAHVVSVGKRAFPAVQ